MKTYAPTYPGGSLRTLKEFIAYPTSAKAIELAQVLNMQWYHRGATWKGCSNSQCTLCIHFDNDTKICEVAKFIQRHLYDRVSLPDSLDMAMRLVANLREHGVKV